MFRFIFATFALVGACCAQAATTSTTMSPTATVDAACQIVSSSALNFSTYDPVAANRTVDDTASSVVQIRCVQGTQVQYSLNQGQNADVDSTCASPKRRMFSSNGQFLKYQIYSDTQRTLVRGCEPGQNVATLPGSMFTSSETSVAVTNYGSIPAGQDVRMGTFADVIGVTITF